MAEARKKDLSLAGFLAWEAERPERWERVGGVVRMMVGGTLGHDRIGINVAGELRERLRGGPCSPHGSKLKVVTPRGDVMYPDAFVRRGPTSPRATTAEDPVVVVEVLSPRTAIHDLTRKRIAYQGIPSLAVVLWVHPDRMRVDVMRRGERGWADEAAAEGPEGVVGLPEIGIELPLAALCEGVPLEEGAAEAPEAG